MHEWFGCLVACADVAAAAVFVSYVTPFLGFCPVRSIVFHSSQAVEDLLLALTRVPQAVPQMIQTVVPSFSQVRCVRECVRLSERA